MAQTSYSTENKTIRETSQLHWNKTLPRRANELTRAEFACAEVKEQRLLEGESTTKL